MGRREGWVVKEREETSGGDKNTSHLECGERRFRKRPSGAWERVLPDPLGSRLSTLGQKAASDWSSIFIFTFCIFFII